MLPACSLSLIVSTFVLFLYGCSSNRALEREIQTGLDPLLFAPDTHKLEFENDKVRVLRVEIPPGYKEPVHTHLNDGVMVIEQRAKIRYFDESGKVVFESNPSRTESTIVQWHEPEGPHSIQNIDNITFKAYLIELKPKK